jgi:hypothetical protein
MQDKEYDETLGSIGRLELTSFISVRYDFGKRIEKNFKNCRKIF